MKLRGSGSLCGCCFRFHCHCWVTMLLMASSIVRVSPEMPLSHTANDLRHRQLPTVSHTSPLQPSIGSFDGFTTTELTSLTTAPVPTVTTTTTTTTTTFTVRERRPSVGQASTHRTVTTTVISSDGGGSTSLGPDPGTSSSHPTTTTSLAWTASFRGQGRGAGDDSSRPNEDLTGARAPRGERLRRPLLSTRLEGTALGRRSRRQADGEQVDKCRLFVEGDPTKNELYSPDYPNDYPKNINCTRVITAPKGQIIRLDFRNSFHIEAKEECKFDFLEIRDGQYGFSNLIGKYCGTDFPPEITSKERYLWLHFHSDESIEYSGFTAVYEFIDRNREAPSTDLNCTIEKDGFEGFINSSDIPHEIREIVVRNKIPLDCMWRIQVQDKWKIQVKFLDFKLSKPNDCETNFLDIFPEQTVMPLRVKNFCGSAGEGITSDSNVLHMRFYAEQVAINSTFAILYTAFRDRGSAACAEGEYDCEDATCIAEELQCNGRDNCKFRWDEEGCATESEGQSEHMIIIMTVFGLILGGMVITFLVNCVRKIMRDQKIIREHIRQSKESKLDEMGRHLKTRSRDNVSIVSPRQKHSQTSLQILDDVSNRYYREVDPITVQTSKADLKEKEHSILRHQQHDTVVQTSLGSGDDTSTTTTELPPLNSATVNACDMGCQTRESLFATASLMRQKSQTHSLADSPRAIEGVPPPPRFSTFGYEAQQAAVTVAATPPPAATASALSRRNVHKAPESIELEQRYGTHVTPHQRAHHHSRPQETCHHHHQHQQHLQQLQQHQQQHQHQQALPHVYKEPQQHLPPAAQQHHSSNRSAPHTTAITATVGGVGGGGGGGKAKPHKVDESKVFIDIRNSAPDVIIMTSH